MADEKQQRIQELKARIAQRSQQLDSIKRQAQGDQMRMAFEPARVPKQQSAPARRDEGMLSSLVSGAADTIAHTPQFVADVGKAMVNFPDQMTERVVRGPAHFQRPGPSGPLYADPPPVDLINIPRDIFLGVAEGAAGSLLPQGGAEMVGAEPKSWNEAARFGGELAGGMLVGRAAKPIARGAIQAARLPGEVYGDWTRPRVPIDAALSAEEFLGDNLLREEIAQQRAPPPSSPGDVADTLIGQELVDMGQPGAPLPADPGRVPIDVGAPPPRLQLPPAPLYQGPIPTDPAANAPDAPWERVVPQVPREPARIPGAPQVPLLPPAGAAPLFADPAGIIRETPFDPNLRETVGTPVGVKPPGQQAPAFWREQVGAPPQVPRQPEAPPTPPPGVLSVAPELRPPPAAPPQVPRAEMTAEEYWSPETQESAPRPPNPEASPRRRWREHVQQKYAGREPDYVSDSGRPYWKNENGRLEGLDLQSEIVGRQAVESLERSQGLNADFKAFPQVPRPPPAPGPQPATAGVPQRPSAPQDAGVDAPMSDWLKDNMKQAAEMMERRGLGEKVEALAAQRKTAGQIARELGVEIEDVLAVRIHRKIPAMSVAGGPGKISQEFLDWEASKKRGASGAKDLPAAQAAPEPPGDPNNFLEEASGAQALQEGKRTGRAAPGAGKDSVVREGGKRAIPEEMIADREADASRAADAARITGGGASGSRPTAGRARQEEGLEPTRSAGPLVQEGGPRRPFDPPVDRGSGEPNGFSGRLNREAQLSHEGIGGKVKSALTGWLSPQFDEFLGEKGVNVVEPTYRAATQARRLENRYKEAVAPAEELQAAKQFFDENPLATEVAANLRERKPLSAEEAAWLRENGSRPEFQVVKAIDEFYDLAREEKLPQLRERGLEIGDLGETYLPYQYRSMGDLIQAMGENWRKRFKEPGFIEQTLGNLEKSRTPGAPRPKGMNYVELFEDYARQLAAAETTKPLSKEIKNLSKEWRAGTKKLEATKLEGYAKTNLGQVMSAADMEWLELSLRELAEQKVETGMKFKSDGRWLPEGDVEVVRLEPSQTTKAPPKYRISINGETQPRIVSEMDILAAKHATAPIYKAVSGVADRMNRLSSILVVGGRLKSAATSIVSNTARTLVSESFDNVAAGAKEAWSYRPKALGGKGMTPEIARELYEQGIRDDSLRAITENPNDTRAMSRAERFYFSNVTGPDNLSKSAIYFARKRGLRQRHPEWTEEQIRDGAGLWTSRFGDMATDAFRAEKAATPGGKMLYHLVAAPMREVSLFVENVRKGDYTSAGKQIGVKAAGVAALVAATGGDPEDFARSMIESVPILGTGLTRGDTVSWNAPGIILERAGKLATGDVKGAAPGSVRQFFPE